jgi:hypothetical protein
VKKPDSMHYTPLKLQMHSSQYKSTIMKTGENLNQKTN